jgi:DNA modification methylase
MNTVIFADALKGLAMLESNSVDTCITSPLYYGLRDYGVNGQIGLESTPDEYIDRLVNVFRKVRRVLKPDGTLWVVIADSYAGSGKGAWKNKNGQKEVYVLDQGSAPTKMPKTFEGIKAKDLIGIPWMLAFALRADGWYLRQDIIWHKTNPMPESVKDRCTKSHEYIFLLSKSPRYYFNAEAIAEPVANSTKKRFTQNIENQNGSNRAYGKNNGPMKACAPRYGGNKYTATPDVFSRTKSGNLYAPRQLRNKRDVWTVCTKGFKGAHFATYPDTLILPCVLAGSKVDGTVLDPFCGSGTTLQVAAQNGRNGIGIEINAEYEPLIKARIGEYKREEVNNDG